MQEEIISYEQSRQEEEFEIANLKRQNEPGVLSNLQESENTNQSQFAIINNLKSPQTVDGSIKNTESANG